MPSLSVHISMNMTKLRSHTVCNTSTVTTTLDRGVMMRMTHTESGVLGHLGSLHPVVSEVVHQDHQRSDPVNMEKQIYHTVNRLRSFLSLGHSVILPFRHSVIPSFRHFVI